MKNLEPAEEREAMEGAKPHRGVLANRVAQAHVGRLQLMGDIDPASPLFPLQEKIPARLLDYLFGEFSCGINYDALDPIDVAIAKRVSDALKADYPGLTATDKESIKAIASYLDTFLSTDKGRSAA